eukprot:m.166820 g.166820  ORF g.166820 m.166820 type:complete len:77 (-) comp12746_c0_seq1:171-401(-)
MADPQATGAGDFAAGLLPFAGQAGQQSGFAAPVGSHQTDAVGFGNCQGEVGKQRLTKGHAQSVCIEKGHLKLGSKG